MLSNKINIAFLISYLPKQGPVQVIYDIVKYVDFEKFEVHILTYKNENENSILSQFEQLPIKIVKFKARGKFSFFFNFNELNAYISKNKIQIVHSHCITSLAFNVFLGKKIKSFHTIHIYPDMQYIAMKGLMIGSLMNLFTKIAIKKILYPIACSDSIQTSFLLNDKINVFSIQNGVSKLKKINESKNELKNKLGLDSDTNYFISVGRFSKEKNFMFLVDSFKSLKLNSNKLIILGDGLMFDNIKEISDDSILLLGFQKKINDYLFASDYYISASLTEGMPLSVLEAMSAGLPVLLSNIKPHLEIIDKSNGLYIGESYNLDDKLDFETKINKLLDINYINIQNNVIEVFDNFFSANKMSEKYQNLYINAINKN